MMVIGYGEVGQAVAEVLGITHIHDPEKGYQVYGSGYQFMHVCIPYNTQFCTFVESYKQQFTPAYVVIHSTVPVGTSRALGALHSPVLGVHPNLADSLRIFTKYIGGFLGASLLADIYRRAGIKPYLTDKPETTELLKLMSTLFYGVMIEFTKEVKALCNQYAVPFEAWTLWTETYNKGYQQLGFSEYTRPLLVPQSGGIGGHCVIPNAGLIESDFAEFIQERQE